MKPTLRIVPCDLKLAAIACRNWHYSGGIPRGGGTPFAVYEDRRFIGAVLFTGGSGRAALGVVNLIAADAQVMELARVALASHRTEVSRIVAICVRLLRAAHPGLDALVSYADPHEGHVGGIYQAGGWIYSGTTQPSSFYIDERGQRRHDRAVSPSGRKKQFGVVKRCTPRSKCRVIQSPPKFRYLMPISDRAREALRSKGKPYPKRAESVDGGTPGHQPGRGGSIPTSALHPQAIARVPERDP